MMRNSISLVFAMALAASGQPALAEWQCLSAGSTVPATVQVASNYLSRAENVYSEQLLGVLRASDRIYLVNARDDGWSERVRLGLMELRLAEPDITAARRFQASLSGGPTPDASRIPAGEFVCLARERAARQGLAFRGEAILLAAGRSVHLVDPLELGIVVEVRAVGGQPLDLREIFAASARAGIYAGLFRGRVQSGPVVAIRPPESAVTFPVGPIGRPIGEVVIMARAGGGERLNDAVAADVPAVPAPATVLAASAPTLVEPPLARVALADVPVAPLPVKPLPQEIPAAVVVAVAEPVPVAAPAVHAPPVVPAVSAPPIAVEPARVARVEAPAAPAVAQPVPPTVPASVVAEIAEPVSIAARVETPALPAPPIVLAVSAPPVAVEPARVARAEVPAAPPAQPLPPVAVAPAATETAAPVLIAARVSAPAPRSAAEQSYVDYAKTMKALLELRRSGGVRSISEMTYVHPAIEDLRARR